MKATSVAAAKQTKKRGRKPKQQKDSSGNAETDVKQSSFRRKKQKPREDYEYEELLPPKNLKKHAILHMETSSSPFNSSLPNHKAQDSSDSVSETQSLKNINLMSVDNVNLMSIENMTVLNEYKQLGKAASAEAVLDEKLNDMLEETEINNSTVFLQKSSKIKQSIKQLEAQLAEYTSSSPITGNMISKTIQDCLNELSGEALSSEELLSYLNYDLGKVLFSLSSILREFEKFALENSITLHPAVILYYQLSSKLIN